MTILGTLFKHLIRWPLEALLFYAVAGVFMILPVGMASALGGALTRLIAPLTPFHRRSLFNIGYAMPSLTKAERHRIILDMWWHIGRVLGEYLHTKALI
ncbi:MAG: lauroyl acyltransferase, partial [Alphaproteobacteria bacterium]|nr:lauroyl acyltransferase [Alphaproteobacteria bacterium]